MGYKESETKGGVGKKEMNTDNATKMSLPYLLLLKHSLESTGLLYVRVISGSVLPEGYRCVAWAQNRQAVPYYLLVRRRDSEQ